MKYRKWNIVLAVGCVLWFDCGLSATARAEGVDGDASAAAKPTAVIAWSSDFLAKAGLLEANGRTDVDWAEVEDATEERMGAEVAKLLAHGGSETVTVQPRATPWWIPPHVPPGDTEYKGHGPIVTVHVYLEIRNRTQLYAVVDFKAIEDRPDWTNAQGRTSFLVWEEPLGRDVLGIVPPYDGSAGYKDSNVAMDVVAGSGVMRQLIAYGDGRGNDAGVHTGCSVTFHPVSVIVRKKP